MHTRIWNSFDGACVDKCHFINNDVIDFMAAFKVMINKFPTCNFKFLFSFTY